MLVCSIVMPSFWPIFSKTSCSFLLTFKSQRQFSPLSLSLVNYCGFLNIQGHQFLWSSLNAQFCGYLFTFMARLQFKYTIWWWWWNILFHFMDHLNKKMAYWKNYCLLHICATVTIKSLLLLIHSIFCFTKSVHYYYEISEKQLLNNMYFCLLSDVQLFYIWISHYH